jgi:hypothetical protein
MLADGVKDQWVYHRDRRIRRPIVELDGPASCSEHRVLSPEVQLLYKSAKPREKDEADFQAVVDHLDASQCRWLRESLLTVSPRHSWLSRLHTELRTLEGADQYPFARDRGAFGIVTTVPHTHQLEFDGDVVRKRFVSWTDGEADREWAGLSLIDGHAPGLGPRPLSRETVDGAPVIVMSRVQGEPLGGAPLSATQIDALGTGLDRLFAVPVQPAIQERAWGPSTMRAGVREWLSSDYDLEACRDSDLVDDAIRAARAWLARDHPDLDRIVDPIITRGDGNLDNALWDGETCRLVDFEEFGVSDITYELADVLEHTSSRLDRYLDPTALTDTFTLTVAQHERLASFRALMASFWLVMLLPGNRGFKRNPLGSTEGQAAHLLALLQS